jgi:hypothetical protein
MDERMDGQEKRQYKKGLIRYRGESQGKEYKNLEGCRQSKIREACISEEGFDTMECRTSLYWK